MYLNFLKTKTNGQKISIPINRTPPLKLLTEGKMTIEEFRRGNIPGGQMTAEHTFRYCDNTLTYEQIVDVKKRKTLINFSTELSQKKKRLTRTKPKKVKKGFGDISSAMGIKIKVKVKE